MRLLPQLQLLQLVSLALADSSQLKPRFDFAGSSGSLLLAAGAKWYAGEPERATVLSAGQQPQPISVRVAGGACDDRRTELVHSCCGGEALPNGSLLPIGSLLPNESTRVGCSRRCQPFVVARLSDTEFSLRLLEPPAASASVDVFEPTLRLRVRVSCRSAELLSPGLSVWSFDRLFLLPANDSFVSPEAVSLLLLRLSSAFDEDSGSVQLLRPEVAAGVRSAPEFVRRQLQIGAALLLNADNCSQLRERDRVLFGNANRRLGAKASQLDVATGRLRYSASGLRLLLRRHFAELPPSSVCVCGLLQFGDRVDGVRFFSVAAIVEGAAPPTAPDATTPPATRPRCRAPDGQAAEAVVLLSGAGHSELACPIVCPNLKETFSFSFGPRRLLAPGANSRWRPNLGHQLLLHSSGKYLRFCAAPPPALSGIYTCTAGGVSYAFSVVVVRPPTFLRPRPPATVFAVEGEGLSFSCTADVGHSATLRSRCSFRQIADSGRWQSASVAGFNELIRGDSRAACLHATEETLATDSGGWRTLRLTLTLQTVPSPTTTTAVRNVTHRHEFLATEQQLPTAGGAYTETIGTDVLFVRRPRLDDFLLAADPGGCEFRASLASDVSAELRRLGVRVRGHFLLDSQRLSAPGVVSFNAEADNLLLLRRLPPRLVGRTLRPVFSFWYDADAQLGSLRPDRRRHAAVAPGAAGDCLGDTLCFYSTQFDAGGQLRPLRFLLTTTTTTPTPTPTMPDSCRLNACVLASWLLGLGSGLLPSTIVAAALGLGVRRLRLRLLQLQREADSDAGDAKS